MNFPQPWRAWHTFQVCLVAALLVLTLAMAVAAFLRVTAGELSVDQTRVMLRSLYWGTYPLGFVALVALAWHFVRSERGDYA